MTQAENHPAKHDGAGRFAGVLSRDGLDAFERFARSPRLSLPRAGRGMKIHVDRVRARPALSPTLSMNLGVGAVGLGLWGLLFPRHVKKTLGVRSPTPVVRALFGVRELITGFTLSADPTRADMLWARVVGDVFDIAALKGLDSPSNPKAGNARLALGLVLAITVLDVLAAVRMTGVERNCPRKELR